MQSHWRSALPIRLPLITRTVLLPLVVCVCACSAARQQESVSAGAGGSRAATAAPSARYTAADVRFVQDMIVHHEQALAMADLVRARTARDDIRLLAQRVAISQEDEIRMLRRWLERRGEPLAPAEGHAHHAMPGMATAEELARLAASTGSDFDRLFLELMIRHHEGALTMVADLFGAGAGREPELFQFASHVDADQRAEIARMRRMQADPPQRGTLR